MLHELKVCAGKSSRGKDGYANATRVKKERLVHCNSSMELEIYTAVRCNKNRNYIILVQQTLMTRKTRE